MDPVENGSPAVESANTEVAESSSPAVETNQVDAESPKTRTPDMDRSALESRVAKSLEQFQEIDTPEEKAAPVITPVSEEIVPTTEDEMPAAQPAVSDDGVAEEKPGTTTETEEQPGAATKPAATVPTLPAALRRSLRAYDWTDAEIDTAMKQNPVGFLLTAQKIHTNRNVETARFAELGRAARTASQPKQGKDAVSSGTVGDDGLLKPLDINVLTEKYGNPELVKELVGPVNEAISRINAFVPDLKVALTTVQRQHTDQLAKQIDGFFAGGELQNYSEHYGKDSATLTENQIKARNGVLELADALVSGAAQQGRRLSVSDALLMAHDHESRDIKAQAIRKEIRSSVQKRATSVTLKPSNSGKPSDNGPVKNRTELESRVRSRLAGVFGN